ncbi:putative methionyl-tRNA synthetase [Hordeum vulgare]|nr:putative methionyl-tRNA synthetase [Hordeum vulgare]
MTTLYESFLKGSETIMTLTSEHDYPKILKDMMKHIRLEGDAVYKGYLFMESGVELCTDADFKFLHVFTKIESCEKWAVVRLALAKAKDDVYNPDTPVSGR